MIEHIPILVTDEQNIKLVATKEEVKQAIFGLNGNSASGSDGFTGKFYQECWEIIKEDIITMVRAFFVAQELPR